MRGKHIFLLLLTICSISFSQIGGRTPVAVMTLEASGIDPSVITSLTDRLRTELMNTGRFDVMERGRMDEILREQGFQQSGACDSDACLVRVGQMLGVARMVAGSVGKVGKVYTASARIIDIELGRVLISKTEDCRDCPIDNLLTESMRNLAQKLAGIAPGGTTPGAVQPAFVEGKSDFYFKSDPPGAKVFIDNQPVDGVTPNSAEGAQAGMHFIRMETDEFTASESIFLEPNEFKKVELKLKRATGG